MIEEGQCVMLTGGGREFFVTAGDQKRSTDKGILDCADLIGKNPGESIESHIGVSFSIRIPRPPDFFLHAGRTGAPMLPKDIGMVIACTGMNRNDNVFDAGTGSGIAAIYFGHIAKTVTTYEIKEDFAAKARKNIVNSGCSNVTVTCGDMLSAEGEFDVVHLDMQITPPHVHRAFELLRPGGYLVTYTPFLEQTFIVMDTAGELFSEVTCHEMIGREMTRSGRGTRPSTRVCHTGYITVARKA